MFGTRRIATVTIALCVLTGCVTQAQHDALRRDLADARNALTELEADRDRNAVYLEAQHTESNDFQKQMADARRSIAELERELELTRAQRDAREAELAEALGDRAALESSVDDMKYALAQANAREVAAQKRVDQFRELLRRFASLIDAGKLRIKLIDGRMVLELPTDILFASGSAKLSDDGFAALAEVGAVLAELGERSFQVEGHTDNVPISTARFPSNWDLAAARALGVVNTLIGAGMRATQLSAASFGEVRPVASNETDEGRALNRRIEIVLVPDLSELPGNAELKKLQSK